MKKIIILVLIVLVILVGCNKKKNFLHNAIMIGSGSSTTTYYFKETFLQENKVSGASYMNENYDPNDPASEKYIYDTDSPKEIIIVIDSIEKEEQIFNHRHEVDYENEILILRLFADTNCSYSLNDIILENGILKIIYNAKTIVTTSPLRCFITIKIEKTEYEKIEFISHYVN